MQIGSGQFRKRISAPTTGTKILVMLQVSYMQDQILGKNEKIQFSAQNLTFPSGLLLPKYKDVFKNFLYGTTSVVIDYNLGKN